MGDKPQGSKGAPEDETKSTARKVATTAVKLVWVVPVVIAAMELLPRATAALSPLIPQHLSAVPYDLLALIEELDAELANDAVA